jgi:hypothetical protein
METGLVGKRADGSAGESGRCASTAEAGRNSAGALSPVETRQVRNDETLRFDRVQWDSVVTGLRGATVRVEKRLDGAVYRGRGQAGSVRAEPCRVAEQLEWEI